MLDRREHSHYVHTYIFKDTMLNTAISDSEKLHLYEQAQIIKSRSLTGTFKEFELVKSFSTVQTGFSSLQLTRFSRVTNNTSSLISPFTRRKRKVENSTTPISAAFF